MKPKVEWFLFRTNPPPPWYPIAIEDHEGNISVGMVHGDEGIKYMNWSAMGLPVKWARVTIWGKNSDDIRAFYWDGSEVPVPEHETT